MDIENLATWGNPVEVKTKLGIRVLRKARPTESFWSAWRSEKEALRLAGISCSKSDRTGDWEICWWQPISKETQVIREEALAASRATDVAIEIPAPEGLTYLPFQKAGIAYLSNRPATLIADEMGLGKTIEAIGVINLDANIKRALIICPASLKLNWQRELEKWLVRGFRIKIATPKEFPEADIIIVNYDILHKHAEKIQASNFDLAVIDECHFAKNKKARRSKQTYAAAKRAKKSLWLSGTPIVNRPVELLPILEAIGGEAMQRVGGGWKYLKRYCNAVQNRFGWDFSGAAHLDELQGILRETCMIRRLKKDVLIELPPKRRQIIELSAESNKSAIEAEQEAVAQHEIKMVSLHARVELAKASEDPADYEAAVQELRAGARTMFTEISRLRHETALVKAPAVIEHIQTIIDEGEAKVVLFAHHHDVIKQFKDAFGDAAVILTGETALADRQAAVDRFQTDPTCQVFIGSITVAGVGLTLTASSHIVFAELDWVPGNMTQAEDRTHRIGQTESVLVQHLVLDGSLDATMARTLVDKQRIIDEALDSVRGAIAEEPVTPFTGATHNATRERIAKDAETITPDQIAAVHEALQLLAGMDGDRAQFRNGVGFSGPDSRIGHELAECSSLTPRQGALGRRIVLRYRNTQLSQGLVERMSLRMDEKNV